jgi:hypothetical protein
VIRQMTRLEFEQALQAVRQANEVLLIHVGVAFRNPTSANIDKQIAGAIESHRAALSVIWTPPAKHSMSAAAKRQPQPGVGS